MIDHQYKLSMMISIFSLQRIIIDNMNETSLHKNWIYKSIRKQQNFQVGDFLLPLPRRMTLDNCYGFNALELENFTGNAKDLCSFALSGGLWSFVIMHTYTSDTIYNLVHTLIKVSHEN